MIAAGAVVREMVEEMLIVAMAVFATFMPSNNEKC